jgi:hypothetical protein
MKSSACLFWVFGLLLAIASIDSLPDPPAVNPPTVRAASLSREAPGDRQDPWVPAEVRISLLVQIRAVALISAYEPHFSTDRIVLTSFATDPSPPRPLPNSLQHA